MSSSWCEFPAKMKKQLQIQSCAISCGLLRIIVCQTFTVLLSSSMILDIPSFLTSLRAACFSFSIAAAAFIAATTDIKAGFCGAGAGAAAVLHTVSFD